MAKHQRKYTEVRVRDTRGLDPLARFEALYAAWGRVLEHMGAFPFPNLTRAEYRAYRRAQYALHLMQRTPGHPSGR